MTRLRAVIRSVGIGSVVGLVIVGNLTFSSKPEKLIHRDLEFTLFDQLETPRHWWYTKWGLAWLPQQLEAVNFMCVPEDSRHFRFLSEPWNIRQSQIVSDCEPLDLSDRRADQLHPNLITKDLAVRRVFFAFDPNYAPQGDWAILVEAKEETYVLVHTDTLRHLGLYDGATPR